MNITLNNGIVNNAKGDLAPSQFVTSVRRGGTTASSSTTSRAVRVLFNPNGLVEENNGPETVGIVTYEDALRTVAAGTVTNVPWVDATSPATAQDSPATWVGGANYTIRWEAPTIDGIIPTTAGYTLTGTTPSTAGSATLDSPLNFEQSEQQNQFGATTWFVEIENNITGQIVDNWFVRVIFYDVNTNVDGTPVGSGGGGGGGGGGS
jgi:hypothetical protein